MAQPISPFFDEALNAARGCIALITGKREASSYFDFRTTGLIGSFIALIIGLGVQAFVPQLLDGDTPAGIATSVMIFGAIVLGVQFAIAYVVLRLLGRADGIVPFIVVQNWASMFQSILAVLAVTIFGNPIAIEPGAEMAQLTSGSIPFLMLGILAIIVSVNVGRLILTLRPLHIAAFVGAQLLVTLLLQPLLGISL